MKTVRANASGKLPAELPARLAGLAGRRQTSARALMVQAIETCVSRGEKREAWRREGMASREECRRTGLLTGEDVLDWPARTAAGEDAEMPECRLQSGR